MEPLTQLRAKIAGFPGYGGDVEQRLSDEYVRSYLGEALANLAARLPLPPDLEERIEALKLRVGFADQRAFVDRHIVGDAPNDGGAVAAADVATVELADRAANLDADSVARFLDDVTGLLDARDAAIRAAALETT